MLFSEVIDGWKVGLDGQSTVWPKGFETLARVHGNSGRLRLETLRLQAVFGGVLAIASYSLFSLWYFNLLSYC